MRKQIPNLITLLNLLAGCIAITMAFRGNFTAVVIWVALAALFDFLDGMAARLLNAYSPIGKELDSLADVVSFGVAPAMAVYVLLRDYLSLPEALSGMSPFVPFFAFLIPLFSAYRLAKFNLDERQSSSFLGLPTPANALFWISYCYGMVQLSPLDDKFLYLTYALILLLSLLMVSEITMFSLKIKSLQLEGNRQQFTLLLLSAALIAVWGVTGIAWSILTYIALSMLTSLIKKRTNK
ncbi:CDP-diacylglycerol--serine O-phosphatidyltransferase [Dysgonomonadaceae bacterium zrk40]|nr:CDP-diacylglycerol--serine O-phosphatidyltransferase [Dysgonomonadaceae bacterium zrk40]